MNLNNSKDLKNKTENQNIEKPFALHIQGGNMKRRIFCTVFAAFFAFSLYAGDSAVLVDNGFSDNGKYYIFGQYGKTDKKFQGWAEIFIVDVAANDYVDNGVFNTKPSAVTADKSGKEVYEALAGRSYFETRKYNCSPANPDRILYIRENEDKLGVDEIVFKDFISSVSPGQGVYSVKLIPSVKGTGLDSSSSFYIELKKKDASGKTLAYQKIGSPNIVRKGVTNYKIERIVCDKTGHNLVFIVEKTVEDKTGVNIRYMIETAVLGNSFFENYGMQKSLSSYDAK